MRVSSKKEIYLGIVFVLILFILIFYHPSPINLISSEQFDKIINSNDVFLINTHTPYIGKINGTDLIAEDWENMEFYKDQLPKDKNTPIAVYCRSGHMSSIAAEQLKKMGYKKIYDLKGGMNAWQESGKEIIQK